MEQSRFTDPKFLFTAGITSMFIEDEQVVATFEERVLQLKSHLDQLQFAEDPNQQEQYQIIRTLLTMIATQWSDSEIIDWLTGFAKSYLLPTEMYSSYQGNELHAWPVMIRELQHRLFN